ncbi:L,D-transpeptidase [Actinocrinis sp.]|uniref:L,D-transpeptidase n=1 Tax=Actinocrinis sp. TaxID=1920516 RepID=UPI002DDD2163|nr:Ig-like domain-containing protein [Actinocrinis sp.]
MFPAVLGIAGTAVAAAGWFGYASSRGHDGFGLGGGSAAAITQPAAQAAAPAAVSVRDGATDVTPDGVLTVAAPPGEQIGMVELTYKTEAVQGVFSDDRRTWTASGPLRAGVSYALSAVTTTDAGGTGIQHETFTTSRPDNPLKLDLVAPTDGSVVGVGQPVVVSFTRPIADAGRAAMEQALSVSAIPPQAGHWSWLSASRVDYRPQSYWKPGTKVSVDLALDGLGDGHGRYGTADRDFGFTVGRDQETTIDLKAERATVRRDGNVVHTFAVTGGMPGLDTWSGTYAVIDKSPDVHMNSRTVGLGDEYDIPDVKWDVHITYTGTYVHSAPWSVGAQGVRNVSHGCIGTSPANAEWFFSNTLPGDVVKVINTPRQVAPGNGFADWQEPWDQWLTGSAVH